MKITLYILQFAAMAVDILVVFALFTVFKISFFIGLIFFAIAHASMKETG